MTNGKEQKVRSYFILFGLLAMITVGICTADTGDRRSLFNGENLEGWKLLNCDAVADNGEILIRDGNGLVQTERQFVNFVLEFEWKALAEDNWDSGVYFRYDKEPDKRPWPSRFQVNLRKGMEGNVDGIKGAESRVKIREGEWNSFRLCVQGNAATLHINGEEAWQGEGMVGPPAGFIALQAEVPQGGQHRFRNIYITELTPAKLEE